MDIIIDFGTDELQIPPDATFSITGIETKEPLVKLGKNFYLGYWDELCGTEIILHNEYSDSGVLTNATPAASVTRRLVLKRIELRPKETK